MSRVSSQSPNTIVKNIGKRYESIASFVDDMPPIFTDKVYVSGYYGGWAPSVNGPKGSLELHRTGASNTSPTEGVAVSVSMLGGVGSGAAYSGDRAQAGYFWDARGDEWKISNQKFDGYMFGAKGDLSQNDTPFFADALGVTDHLYALPGNYRFDDMLELNASKTLQISAGVIIERTVDTPNTDPIIWMKGSFGSLIGAGQVASRIRTKNKSPNGVVLVGHVDMATSHGNVLYNTIRDLGIQGMQAYGQTVGAHDIALHIQNPQIGGTLAVYFQTISGIRVSDVNYGLYLHGGANGNTISDLQGFRTGDDSGSGNGGALIYDHGSLDNSVSGLFHHFSPNSTTIKMESLDNTANGGTTHATYASSYSNIVCEQGGGAEKGVKAEDGSVRGCYFDIRHNTAGGNNLDSGFKLRNAFFGLNPLSSSMAELDQTPDFFEWFSHSEGSQTARVVEFADQFTGLSENTSYRMFDVSVSSASFSALVELSVASAWGSSVSSSNIEKAIYKVERDGAGTVTAECLSHFKSDKSSARGLNFPDISSNSAIFSYRTKNNGSALTNQRFMFKAKIVNAIYSSNITRYDTSTVYTPVTGVVADWGVSGSFTAVGGEVVTVTNGLITEIV